MVRQTREEAWAAFEYALCDLGEVILDAMPKWFRWLCGRRIPIVNSRRPVRVHSVLWVIEYADGPLDGYQSTVSGWPAPRIVCPVFLPDGGFDRVWYDRDPEDRLLYRWRKNSKW